MSGLPAQGLDPTSGQPVGAYIVRISDSSPCSPTYFPFLQTWGGGSDSYFEYLIKYARLTNTADSSFADAWLTAVDSSIKYLQRVSSVYLWFSLLTVCQLDVYCRQPRVFGRH